MQSDIVSAMKITGKLHIELFGADGVLKQEVETTNLVVTAGKNVIADRMKAAPAKAAMTHMGVGTSATAAAIGDTDLLGSLTRQALTSTTVAAAVITYVGTFNAGTGTGTIAECGIMNAAAAGDMLCRSTGFTPIVKGAGDTMVVTWTVTIS